MIQFNLLPDVKKEYIKAKRTKRLILTISGAAASGSIVVVLLFFSVVQIAQKNSIKDLTEDIKNEISSIESIEDLDKILTIQSQLKSLPALHESKPLSSRLFNYLIQLTPSAVKISLVEVDFDNNTMIISGSADSLASINQYADTLKFSKYSIKDVEGTSIPFSNVISELNRDDKSASYTIELVFDPVLFNNVEAVTLIVPEQVTTRSTTGKPNLDDSNLFEPIPNNEEGEQ